MDAKESELKTENRILIVAGLALVILTMAFGVWYALFDEHQTLVGMGVSMANGFADAARGDLESAYLSLDKYAAISREYHAEVHFHGHWGMLGLILIVYGVIMDSLSYSARTRLILAVLLASSATMFPLGVLLQASALHAVGKSIAMLGSVGMVLGMIALAAGVLRRPGE